MLTYTHKVHYYETDKMGIVHHSNYIKWMEEARMVYLNKIGLSFKKLEDMGYVSPVIGVNVEYVNPTTFDDEIIVETSLSKYNGVALDVSYIMKNKVSEVVVAKAKSKHCFIKDKVIVPLQRDNPQMDAILKSVLEESITR
ncbi:MAG: acyl-CoA thioesterase [Eubacteriales bacterium]|nr:acyl-CoA thioesterase [Eubacteriales bacterium]